MIISLPYFPAVECLHRLSNGSFVVLEQCNLRDDDLKVFLKFHAPKLNMNGDKPSRIVEIDVNGRILFYDGWKQACVSSIVEVKIGTNKCLAISCG